MIVPLILLHICPVVCVSVDDLHAASVSGSSGHNLIGSVLIRHKLEVLCTLAVFVIQIDIGSVVAVIDVEYQTVAVSQTGVDVIVTPVHLFHDPCLINSRICCRSIPLLYIDATLNVLPCSIQVFPGVYILNHVDLRLINFSADVGAVLISLVTVLR